MSEMIRRGSKTHALGKIISLCVLLFLSLLGRRCITLPSWRCDLGTSSNWLSLKAFEAMGAKVSLRGIIWIIWPRVLYGAFGDTAGATINTMITHKAKARHWNAVVNWKLSMLLLRTTWNHSWCRNWYYRLLMVLINSRTRCRYNPRPSEAEPIFHFAARQEKEFINNVFT